MGQELEICSGVYRDKSGYDSDEDLALRVSSGEHKLRWRRQQYEMDWEVEAQETWEKMDRKGFLKYLESLSREERKALKKLRSQRKYGAKQVNQKRRPDAPSQHTNKGPPGNKNMVFELDAAVDRFLGIEADPNKMQTLSVEMTHIASNSEHIVPDSETAVRLQSEDALNLSSAKADYLEKAKPETNRLSNMKGNEKVLQSGIQAESVKVIKDKLNDENTSSSSNGKTHDGLSGKGMEEGRGNNVETGQKEHTPQQEMQVGSTCAREASQRHADPRKIEDHPNGQVVQSEGDMPAEGLAHQDASLPISSNMALKSNHDQSSQGPRNELGQEKCSDMCPVNDCLLRDLLSEESESAPGWESTKFTKIKTKVKHIVRLWQGSDMGWFPPYSERKLKVEHLIKGPLANVWEAFNNFNVRKSYDERYEGAKIVKKISDNCDVLYTSFEDSALARVDFCDYRRFWAVETERTKVPQPPAFLAMGANSHIAHCVVYMSAGTTFDELLPNNECTRGETLSNTGMIFREFVSATNPKEKWTRVVYPNSCNFNITLLEWIPQGKYVSRSYSEAVDWRKKVDKAVNAMSS